MGPVRGVEAPFFRPEGEEGEGSPGTDDTVAFVWLGSAPHGPALGAGAGRPLPARSLAATLSHRHLPASFLQGGAVNLVGPKEIVANLGQEAAGNIGQFKG